MIVDVTKDDGDMGKMMKIVGMTRIDAIVWMMVTLCKLMKIGEG